MSGINTATEKTIFFLLMSQRFNKCVHCAQYNNEMIASFDKIDGFTFDWPKNINLYQTYKKTLRFGGEELEGDISNGVNILLRFRKCIYSLYLLTMYLIKL